MSFDPTEFSFDSYPLLMVMSFQKKINNIFIKSSEVASTSRVLNWILLVSQKKKFGFYCYYKFNPMLIKQKIATQLSFFFFGEKKVRSNRLNVLDWSIGEAKIIWVANFIWKTIELVTYSNNNNNFLNNSNSNENIIKAISRKISSCICIQIWN